MLKKRYRSLQVDSISDHSLVPVGSYSEKGINTNMEWIQSFKEKPTAAKREKYADRNRWEKNLDTYTCRDQGQTQSAGDRD